MCEVLNPDGTAPCIKPRAAITNDGYWLGYEQEYTFVVDGRPLGFPANGFPSPQGMTTV